MIELRAFYELLSILPSELGQAVVKGLEGLLRRPRRRFDSGLGPKGLSWVSCSRSRSEDENEGSLPVFGLWGSGLDCP